MTTLLLKVDLAVKTLNLEISSCRLEDHVRQRIVPKCVPHVQHDYFSSFDQSFHCFLTLSSLTVHSNGKKFDQNVTHVRGVQWKSSLSISQIGETLVPWLLNFFGLYPLFAINKTTRSLTCFKLKCCLYPKHVCAFPLMPKNVCDFCPYLFVCFTSCSK